MDDNERPNLTIIQGGIASTNDQWKTNCVEYLRETVDRYLSGQPLDTHQYAMITSLLCIVGWPPEMPRRELDF